MNNRPGVRLASSPWITNLRQLDEIRAGFLLSPVEAPSAANGGVDNLIFVINCNVQHLDGPVRGNGKIVQELKGVFRAVPAMAGELQRDERTPDGLVVEPHRAFMPDLVGRCARCEQLYQAGDGEGLIALQERT